MLLDHARFVTVSSMTYNKCMKWVNRNKTVLILAAVTILLIVIVIVYSNQLIRQLE